MLNPAELKGITFILGSGFILKFDGLFRDLLFIKNLHWGRSQDAFVRHFVNLHGVLHVGSIYVENMRRNFDSFVSRIGGAKCERRAKNSTFTGLLGICFLGEVIEGAFMG